MSFFKKNNVYKITRVTGNRDNILGISFSDDSTNENIEVIEWEFPNTETSNIRTSKNEVLNQVIAGLNSINESLGSNYKLSKIYYVPSEDSSCLVYKTLIRSLIKHYHNGKKFKEV